MNVKEAQKLTQKGEIQNKKLEIDRVFDQIKHMAKDGRSFTYFEYFQFPETKERLLKEGYTLDIQEPQTCWMGDLPGSVKVSW